MNAVAHETRQAIGLLDRVEKLEGVARSLPERDTRRNTLLGVVESDLAAADPLRPCIAAKVLRLSEPTIRAWVEQGVLTRAETTSSRLLLDVVRVHQVLHLLEDLRSAGKTAGLLDEVYRRLVDATWLGRPDLTDSLEQMRRGDGKPRGGTLAPSPM
jgi:hypothetical protein